MLIKKVDEIIMLHLDYIKRHIFIKLKSLDFEFSVAVEIDNKHSIKNWEQVKFPFYIFDEKKYYHFRATYKNDIADECERVLFFDLDGEIIVLINGSHEFGIDMMHKVFNVSNIFCSKSTEDYQIELEFYSGHWVKSATNSFRAYSKDKIILSHKNTKDEYPVIFKGVSLCEENTLIKEFYYDLLVLNDIAASLPEYSLRRNNIFYELYKILIDIDISSENPQLLCEHIKNVRSKVNRLLACKNSDSTPLMALIGHAHIDLAWLWTKEQGSRKVVKTFATVTKLMKDYPELVFTQTQSLFLEIVSNYDSKLIQEIINANNNGNWEPCGCMYVEPDCNLLSGESMIRQLLIGIDTFNRFFSDSTKVAWLPDAFGFSPCLPQILNGFGIEHLATHKLIWNDTNKFPYDLFIWYGNDASSIKVLVTTGKLYGYSGKVNLECINDTWNNIQHKEIQSTTILPVGMGDGGGGPTIDDLEYASRISDLEGCPKTQWMKVKDAINQIFSKDEGVDYPEHYGEIYFERHRGTYTTQSDVKWWNRKLEYLLREFEYVICFRYDMQGMEENSLRLKLERMWKKLLKNQSHDIIAGTCISEVYSKLIHDINNYKMKYCQI